MAAGVEGERPLTHGTDAGAHAARDAMERDAALRLELEDPQVHARPAVGGRDQRARLTGVGARHVGARDARLDAGIDRSEEHTSELQSQSNLVCRLLLEKKKKKKRGRLTIVHY